MEKTPAGRRGTPAHLVLNRSWADLYDEVAGLFAGRSDIRVVVDRRGRGRGDGGRVLMDKGRSLSARLVPEQLRKGVSWGLQLDWFSAGDLDDGLRTEMRSVAKRCRELS